MGAWGAGPFDNDDALDWLAALSASRDFAAGRGHLTWLVRTISRHRRPRWRSPPQRSSPRRSDTLRHRPPMKSLRGSTRMGPSWRRGMWRSRWPQWNVSLPVTPRSGNVWTDAGDDEWLESVHGLRQRLVDAMAAT
jgi:Domain of unknown function (DUF4259)